jgi:hypothetical protein
MIMKYCVLGLSALLLLLPAPAQANALPPEMLVDGKPVDPLCFADAIGGERSEIVSLRGCGASTQVTRREEKDEGRTHSATYTYIDESSNATVNQPYADYTYIGIQNNLLVVQFNWGGGGSGHFTDLLRLRRTEEQFEIVDYIAGGDRCNGGVSETALDANGVLSYAQYVTPYDLFTLGSAQNSPYLQSVAAYDDLDACAICCYGTVKVVDGVITNITLDSALKTSLPNKEPELNEDGKEKLQVCFDKLVLLNLDDTQKEKSMADWNVFIREFEHICLGRVEGQ